MGIFITGATGFLGSNLLREIATRTSDDFYILIRAKDDKSAVARKNILTKQIFPQSMGCKVYSRIHIVRGDLTKEGLGISKKDAIALRNNINTVYHCAASRELVSEAYTIKNVNVEGTQNILKVALDWKKNGCLENVNHISTAYIAGDYEGKFYEEQFAVSQSFNNPYEQSKFEAEKNVLRYRRKGLPIDIYRPSIISDSMFPKTKYISVFLQILSVFLLEIFEKIPANVNTKLNIIPVDAASETIYLISTAKGRTLNQTYHIVNPKPTSLLYLLNMGSIFFKFKKPRCIPFERFRLQDLSGVQRKIIEPFVPYLNQRISFDMRNTLSVLKGRNFRIPSIGKKHLIKVFRHYKSAGLIPKKIVY